MNCTESLRIPNILIDDVLYLFFLFNCSFFKIILKRANPHFEEKGKESRHKSNRTMAIVEKGYLDCIQVILLTCYNMQKKFIHH